MTCEVNNLSRPYKMRNIKLCAAVNYVVLYRINFLYHCLLEFRLLDFLRCVEHGNV